MTKTVEILKNYDKERRNLEKITTDTVEFFFKLRQRKKEFRKKLRQTQ